MLLLPLSSFCSTRMNILCFLGNTLEKCLWVEITPQDDKLSIVFKNCSFEFSIRIHVYKLRLYLKNNLY